MKNILHTKNGSLLLVFIVYTIAFVVAGVIFYLFRTHGVLWATLFADIAATLVVWSIGLVFKNASLYDPYWSIVPVMVIPFWVIIKNTAAGATDILLITAIVIWGIRLTMNWVISWNGLGHQDWRYTMLKEKNPDIWFITNLGGINMMPTLLVFMGMIPAYYIINGSQKINVFSVIGFLICIAATAVQFISDRQMMKFRSDINNDGKCIENGLWKYTRHPNYLGEVSLWWGIWIMQIGASPSIWVTIIGPVFITLLFVFISIPMMEKHVSSKRPEYLDYKKRVPMLIPISLNKNK